MSRTLLRAQRGHADLVEHLQRRAAPAPSRRSAGWTAARSRRCRPASTTGAISNRVRRVGAPPARELGQGAVGEVPLVHERAGQRPGPGVQVLVGAPGRPVDAPVVQAQRHVARRVRQIPADDRAGGLSGGGDRVDVEQLAGEVVHRAEQDAARPGGPLRSGTATTSSVRSAVLTGARPQPHDRLVGVEAVEGGLAAHGVAVRGERAVLDDDRVPLAASAGRSSPSAGAG